MFSFLSKGLRKLSLKRTRSQVGVTSHSSRTHNCGQLSLADVDKSVILCGWVKHVRMQTFIVIGDSFGSTQLIIDDVGPSMEKITKESVVHVEGTVRKRPCGMANPNMSTGEVEVVVSRFNVLNNVISGLSIPVDSHSKSYESSLMKYRYLHLRKQEMQRNLRFRSDFGACCREFLIEQNGFVEVETPLLFKKTSGGAREFIVPTKYKDMFYALPQSPQLMKQMLMVGGLDRYFQFARCFRDETTTKDRQPEFTQIDIEMSFVEPEGVMELTQQMLTYVLSNLINLSDIDFSFSSMTYKTAMTLYGTDKPDLRYDFMIDDVTNVPQIRNILVESEICSPTDSVYAFTVDSSLVSSVNFSSIKKTLIKGDNTNYLLIKWDLPVGPMCQKLSSNNVKTIARMLGLKNGDYCFISCGLYHIPTKLLGIVRTKVIESLEFTKAKISPNNILKFTWIYDFPLFTTNEEGDIESSHHPFTVPHPDDMTLLSEGYYSEVRGRQFDLVLNGVEVGGGSIRIHDHKMQKRIFTDFLKLNVAEIGEFFDSLKSGCPPHGGIALGFDRLLALILNTNSIRDVIAFPKSSDGSDPLFGCPAKVDRSDLIYYHIESRKKLN